MNCCEHGITLFFVYVFLLFFFSAASMKLKLVNVESKNVEGEIKNGVREGEKRDSKQSKASSSLSSSLYYVYIHVSGYKDLVG